MKTIFTPDLKEAKDMIECEDNWKFAFDVDALTSQFVELIQNAPRNVTDGDIRDALQRALDRFH